MICFDVRCDRAILAGGFLMIIYGFVYSSLVTCCFGFLDSKLTHGTRGVTDSWFFL